MVATTGWRSRGLDRGAADGYLVPILDGDDLCRPNLLEHAFTNGDGRIFFGLDHLVLAYMFASRSLRLRQFVCFAVQRRQAV